MGKASNKDNKNVYQLRREELGLTREAASELVNLSPERILRIENEKFIPRPDEIVAMARGYRMPALCNYYCANQCEIGQHRIPEIQVKDLSQIVLSLIASVNSAQKDQERLIEISEDGVVSENEIEDFALIRSKLEKISVTVQALQLWVEQMIADGKMKASE